MLICVQSIDSFVKVVFADEQNYFCVEEDQRKEGEGGRGDKSEPHTVVSYVVIFPAMLDVSEMNKSK